MKKQEYSKMKAQLQDILEKSFTLKLEYDIDEAEVVKAQINTSEPLNDSKLEAISELQEDWRFINKTISRQDNGIKIVMNVA